MGRSRKSCTGSERLDWSCVGWQHLAHTRESSRTVRRAGCSGAVFGTERWSTPVGRCSSRDACWFVGSRNERAVGRPRSSDGAIGKWPGIFWHKPRKQRWSAFVDWSSTCEAQRFRRIAKRAHQWSTSVVRRRTHDVKRRSPVRGAGAAKVGIVGRSSNREASWFAGLRNGRTGGRFRSTCGATGKRAGIRQSVER
jgi:hypothetical protein